MNNNKRHLLTIVSDKLDFTYFLSLAFKNNIDINEKQIIRMEYSQVDNLEKIHGNICCVIWYINESHLLRELLIFKKVYEFDPDICHVIYFEDEKVIEQNIVIENMFDQENIYLFSASSEMLAELKKLFKTCNYSKIRDKNVSRLSKGQQKIVTHVCKGYSNKQIANILSLSPRTVETHLYTIYKKLNISSRSELIAKYHRLFIEN